MEGKVKLLLVLPFFYPHRGGSQKYAEELYAKMCELHPNVEVDVLCYNTDRVAEYEAYRGFNVYRIPCWNIIPARFALPNPIALLQKLRELKKNGYTHVNTHIRFFDPTWWLWHYARRVGAKSIFTGHVSVHPVHQNRFVEITAKIVDITLAKWSLKHYDMLTFTNKTAIKFFKEHLGVTYTDRVHLIYGGIDTEFFKPRSEKTSRCLPKVNINISDDKVLVTFVGRLIWTKGVTYLMDALELLKNTDIHSKAIFVLAGPGELEDQIKKRVKEADLGGSVFLTGDLSYLQVRDLLSISDVFINPSNHSEGFPNTVLEAGACGCYVIATDNAGTSEVITSEITGALVTQKSSEEFANAIHWAVNHPGERAQIAMNFRRNLVEGFDWKIISEKLYSLLLQ